MTRKSAIHTECSKHLLCDKPYRCPLLDNENGCVANNNNLDMVDAILSAAGYIYDELSPIRLDENDFDNIFKENE